MDENNDFPLDLLRGIAEIAQFLRISPRTVERWVANGKLPVKRIGRTVVARRCRLAEFVDTPDGDQRAA
jgi:excisionase family DNA binding protein